MTRESEFRERLREWAARPPRRPALDVARRARAAGIRRRRPVSAPFVWVAAALAAALVALALSTAAERGRAADPPVAVRPTPAAVAAPAAARFVVVELRSGNRLYVDLATVRRTS